MIQRLSHTSIYALDQDAARDIYVNKLGFDVRDDHTMDNGFRWLTVGTKTQPDVNVILMKVDNPNVEPDVAKTLRDLLERGILSGGSSTFPIAARRTKSFAPKASSSSSRRPRGSTGSRRS